MIQPIVADPDRVRRLSESLPKGIPGRAVRRDVQELRRGPLREALLVCQAVEHAQRVLHHEDRAGGLEHLAALGAGDGRIAEHRNATIVHGLVARLGDGVRLDRGIEAQQRAVVQPQPRVRR